MVPQQIRGRLKLEGKPSVSHETIYKMLREDKESGGCLYLHTRHRLKKGKDTRPDTFLSETASASKKGPR